MASPSENAAAPLEEAQAPPPPNPNPSGEAAGEGAEGQEEEPKTLERAQELFDRGSKAIEDEDFVDAVDCLSRALEIRTAHYGELAPECGSTYFKYGCALLYKAQEETDPLGNVPKSEPNEESVKSTTAKADSECSKASGTNAEDAVSSEKVGGEEGESSNGKDHGDGNGEIEKDDDDDDDDDEKMGDEEESDLDLSWKMLDIARAIAEKSPDNTMEKVKIYSALGEVALEREDIDNSLGDYKKALAMVEQLVEPDHRRIVELNFRICLVYELASKIGEAIPYCAKAISLCKSRIQSLKDSKDASLAGKDGESAAEEGSEKSAPEAEIEQLTGILTELEKKLEDLEQAVSNPNPIAEALKVIASRAAAAQKGVLLLMQSALKFPISESTESRVISMLTDKLRTPHLNIAEITEMIHVASLIHDDVLDDADTRRGVSSLNLVVGNKVSVLAGDFLLSRACGALAALGNYEVASLMTTALEDIVTGEIMQNFPTREQQRSIEYYLQKNYYKTASLISNSCKSVAILAGHTAEVSKLAYEYGRNLGLAFQLTDDVLDFTGTSASLGKGSLSDIRNGIITAPILYAMEEFPQLHEVVDSGFEDPANVELALDYLQKSRGIERAKELAREHANRAIKAIEALPDSDDEDVLTSRRALIDMTERVITRTK